jgi:hypothetical protein
MSSGNEISLQDNGKGDLCGGELVSSLGMRSDSQLDLSQGSRRFFESNHNGLLCESGRCSDRRLGFSL